MDRAVFYIFVLLALVIAVAYYVGTVADVGAIGNALQQLFFALSGRTSAGNFAAYPSGG